METLKDLERELHRFRRRLLVALLGVLLAFSVLVARWVWLQVLRHRKYSLQARDNRIAIEPTPPSRGLILDRNGIVLADNYAAYTLEITPSRTLAGVDATLRALRQLIEITPTAERRFRSLLAQNRSFEPTPVRNRLSDVEVARFVAQRFRFPGVQVRARLFRRYPLGSLGSHAIGYVGRIGPTEQARIAAGTQARNYQGTDHIGKTGVELSYETQLHGATGFDEVEVNAAGRPVRRLRSFAAVPGSSLVLSIDARLQKLAEDLYGDRTGACVVMDPRNGEVLAFASMPMADPNLFVEGIDQADWTALNTDPRKPMLNRVLRGTFPPGSTYKPYLGVGALTLGVRTADYTLRDPGFFMLGKHKFRDDIPGGHGMVDMHKAIAVSCDTYFYMVANDWGVDGMHDYTRQFGFGQPTGVDLPDEARGILPSKSWKRHAYRTPALQRWYPGETISLGIGQGYNSFTPIQMANALATMASRGRRVKPRVVRMVEDMETRRFVPTPIEVVERIAIPDAAWQVIHGGMVAVNAETYGTGYAVFHDAPYTSAGKTGTAQVFTVAQNQKYHAADLARHLRDHALYTCYAPAEDPVVCVALIVEHAGFGAASAAPIARKLLDFHLLGKYPDDAEITRISGRAPKPVAFRYASGRNGVPDVPGAREPAPAPAPATKASGAAPAAPASAASAPAPRIEPWPQPLATGTSGAPMRTACAGTPLFTRFRRAPDRVDPDEGVPL